MGQQRLIVKTTVSILASRKCIRPPPNASLMAQLPLNL